MDAHTYTKIFLAGDEQDVACGSRPLGGLHGTCPPPQETLEFRYCEVASGGGIPCRPPTSASHGTLKTHPLEIPHVGGVEGRAKDAEVVHHRRLLASLVVLDENLSKRI